MALSLAPPKMSQATIVVGLMLAAFVLWLAANNRLVVYWNILTGRSAGSSAQAPNTVVNNPVSTTGQPTTGTASGTVTPIEQTPSLAAGNATQVPGTGGF